MDDERNIQLTVVHPPQEDENEVRIDLSLIFGYCRRFFVLWLATAVAFGAIVLAVVAWRQDVTYIGDAMALIAYSYDGAAAGLAPDGKKLDPSKLQSPSVVESAFDELGIGMEKMDNVRTNLKIEGLMSDEAYSRRVLYNNMLSKSNSVNMDLINSLLNMESGATKYIVSFDYNHAGFSREKGVELLNAILNAYRKEFEESYNYNVALGSSLQVVDYKDYDFAEAVTIFSDCLDNIENYLDNLKSGDGTGFRSNQTGSTFDDLLVRVSTLRDIDLDQAASYITSNAVTRNGAAREIAHYEWLIEDLNRQKTVLETKLASLSESIAAYEKDPVTFFASGDSSVKMSEGATDYYDSMVKDKLDTQQQISRYLRTIRFYQSEIEKLRSEHSVTPQMKDRADTYLASLNEAINQVIDDVKTTADEYYSKASFSKTVQTLVPAMAEAPSITGGDLKMSMIAVEGVLLVLYLGASVVLGIKASNAKEDSKPDKPQVAAGN